MKCPCGRDGTHTLWSPTNIHAGLREFKKPSPLCTYHVEKAKLAGFEVSEGVQVGEMQLR